VIAALACAAGLILALRLGSNPGHVSPQGRAIAKITFRRVDSLSSLDPLARSVFDDFTGGASFALPTAR
jgi:hypothetical protein